MIVTPYTGAWIEIEINQTASATKMRHSLRRMHLIFFIRHQVTPCTGELIQINVKGNYPLLIFINPYKVLELVKPNLVNIL